MCLLKNVCWDACCDASCTLTFDTTVASLSPRPSYHIFLSCIYIYIYIRIYIIYICIYLFIFKCICIHIYSFTAHFLFFLQSLCTLRSGLPVLLYTHFRALPLFYTSSFVSMYVCIHVYTLRTTDCALPCMYDCMSVCVIFPYDRAIPLVHIHVYMNVYISHTYYRALSPIVLPVYLYIPRTCVSKRM